MENLPQVILGSTSSRRKEILGYFTLPFLSVSPSFDEDSIPFKKDPGEYVIQIAEGKADSLSKEFPKALLITADTTVFFSGKIFGKPKNENEAFQILSELSGKEHHVYTGVTVQKGNQRFSKAEVTQVRFRSLTKEERVHYIHRTQWNDKAAGYAIQGPGGLIVQGIEGCHYNVMGLPINTLEKLLKNFGVELWHYL